ncbi:MAG: energy-coupled thiamine transporter ThiT [Firmicutes bacterium]|nr:energy-coupled thiamine transporter ThiT [Bacillota bacterium]
MENQYKNRASTSDRVRRLTGMAMLTAIVVILQFLGQFIHLGPFSISLVLLPIVIGAALYGPLAGGWLGFVFSLVVLYTDASAFLAVSVPGTVITVIAKGTCAGLAAGAVYSLTQRWNPYVAVTLAAAVAPIVNTGIFLIGCRIFFWPTIAGWAAALGFESAFAYAIVGMVGVNFLAELAVNLVCSPAVLRILKAIRI